MGRLAPTCLVVALLAAALISACGASEPSAAEQREGADREQVEALASRFGAAVAAKDAKAFCATLAPNDVERLGAGKSDGTERCLVVWGEGRNPLFKAKEADLSLKEIIELKATSASAELANGGELAFVKEGGAWHVHLAPAKE